MLVLCTSSRRTRKIVDVVSRAWCDLLGPAVADSEEMGKVRKAFYAVRVGRNTGVYTSWEECKAQVDGYPGAVYKGFQSRSEAAMFVSPDAGRPDPIPAPATAAAPKTYRSFLSEWRSRQQTTHGTSHKPSRHRGAGSPPRHSSRPVVYTDGCCFSNGQKNAHGGVGVYWGKDHAHNVSEMLEGNQTNQRAEVVSACRGLETAIAMGLKSVEVRTDSKYTIRAITEWVERWRDNGWKTALGGDVKNKSDFQRLDSLCHQVDVKWTHIPGHVGIHGNEEADKLAKMGSQKT